MITDAINAVDRAAFTVLDAAISTAGVFQHPPEDTALPIVVIADMDDIKPIGGRGDDDIEMVLTVAAMTEGEERMPCARLVAEARAALHDRHVVESGFAIRFYFEGASISIDESGLGYLGLAQFRVHAQQS